MSSNLSSKQLRYVSMMASLFLGLKEDLGLNLSATKDRSSFLKCHISRSFLPYSSNSVSNNNLTKEQREALYSLKDDTTIIIKGADKGSVVVIWDREDYLKEVYRQLDDKEVYD